MFSSISWPEFILYLTVLLIIYYGFIVFVFYRQEVAEFIKNRKALQRAHAGKRMEPQAPVTSPFIRIKEELDEYFEGCAKIKPIPEEFVMGLQSLVHASSFVPDAKEKILLHKYITETSKRICSIALDPGEVDRIWR